MAIISISCKKNTNRFASPYQLKIVEANGYVVPKDSMAPPNASPYQKPRITPVIKNKIGAAETNAHVVDSSLNSVFSILPGVPTPGEGNFLLPEKTIALHVPVIRGIPSVVVAKEVKAANPNLQNFLSGNKLRGYNAFENGNNKTLGLMLKVIAYQCFIVNTTEQFIGIALFINQT